jgi:hypothetical protein
MKSNRSKACDISPAVRRAVEERDGGRSILSGLHGIGNSHYIPRSLGGLGIVENIVTLTPEEHRRYDEGSERNRNVREEMKAEIKEKLDKHYPGFPDDKRIYHKYDW